MKIPLMQVVLHTDFGGFHLNDEMCLWLMENKGWKVDVDFIKQSTDYNYPIKDNIEFRSNKDLIECVQVLKEIHKNDKYPESYYAYIHKLEVVSLYASLSIEDYHDGKERVDSYIGVE